MFRRAILPGLALGLAVTAASTAQADTQTIHSATETRLVEALSQLHNGEADRALDDLNSLIQERPDFRLAQYVYGDIMLAKAGQPGDVANGRTLSDRRHALLEEARTRWSHRLDSPPPGTVPNTVLKLAPQYAHVVVVDLVRNRLYLLENNGSTPKLVADFYASIGVAGIGKQEEGDAKTPVGVYHVTEYKHDTELPELYGDGAFPVNYPNPLDRLFGRTGYGIWVHGVPRNTYNRAPRTSQGCVVISNEDLAVLKRYLEPGKTPVVFTNQLEWLTPAQAQAKRDEFMSVLADWQHSWENVQTDRYLGFYADDFITDNGMEKARFAEYKRRVNADKTQIDVELDDISVYSYPAHRDMAMVSFTQRYSSNNFQAVARKQQFWRLSPDSGWQIMHETRGE